MILLQIYTSSKHTSDAICEWMLTNNYCFELHNTSREHITKDKKRLISYTVYKISCLTKAVLFSQIVKEIEQKFGKEPKIFSLPVTQIEEDWANDIRTKIVHS